MLYCNKTRYPAIVTLRIDEVEASEKALQLGVAEALEFLPVTVGTYDLMVGAGQELHLANNTKATVLHTRSAL